MLPDILRPNVPEFNEPGGLCTDAQFAARRLPGAVAGRQRARDHAGAAVRALGPGLHGPGDGQRRCRSSTCCCAASGLEVVAEGAQRFFQGDQDRQHLRRPARRAAGLLRAEHQGRPERDPEQLLRRSAESRSTHRKFDYPFTGQNGKRSRRAPTSSRRAASAPRRCGASIASKTSRSTQGRRQGEGALPRDEGLQGPVQR